MRMADYFEGRLEFENAAEHWAAIVRQNPEELEVRDKLVSYYLVSKDLEALRGIYEYERKKSQASADLYEDLGNLYVMAGDTGKAVEVYQEMAARFPRNERALTRLLDISEYRGEREKALTYSRQLADYYPDNRDYALRYAQKVIQYQPAEAEKLIQGWIQKFSQTQDFLLILAEFYIQQGKKKEAVDVLQSILQKNPQNTAVIRSLGENLYSLHQYEDARELLENYHARTGGTYHTHHLLGDVYNALGNASAGRREYEEALRQLRE